MNDSAKEQTPATDPAPVTIKETIAGTVLRMEQGYTGGMNDLSVTPATDPAPAVCEWTKRGRNEPGFYNTPHGLCHINHLPKSGGCWCGNPIKFTEAQR